MVKLEKLKSIVSERGCSMKWLSDKTGIPYRRVIDLFSGRTSWTVMDAQKVSAALDIPAKDRHDIFF